jgi:protein O-mannosyl-transferase
MKLNQNQFNSLAAGLMIVVAVLVYSNSFTVPFQFDDIYHITQKTTIKNIGNFGKLSTWSSINSRPLPMFTLALNYRWGGVNPAGYHVFNLIFHILAGWAVYLLVLQILSLKNFKPGKAIFENKEYFALAAALIFLAHPLQTQAVTYVIQRITALAGLFYLLGLLYYIKARALHLETGDYKPAIKNYILTFVFFGLSLMSKQTAVTFPLALMLTEFFFIRDNEGQLQKKFLLILAGVTAVIFIIGLSYVGIPRESKEISRSVYLFTSFRVLLKYIQLFFLPINQNLDYDFKASRTLFELPTIGSLLILAGLIYLAYRLFNNHRLISFGIAFFFLTLLVEQSIIPIKDFIFEHRLYLPMFGLILSTLAALFTLLPQMDIRKAKVPMAIAVSAVLVLALGFAANARNRVWKSDFSLWSDAARKSPEKGRPYLWLGISYSNKGDYKNAKKSLDKSIELMPNVPMGYYNRGNVYKELDNYKAALEDYNKAISLNKTYMMAYFNRGVVRAKLGQYAAAIEDYNITLKDDPRSANTYYNRGNAYRNLRKYKEAIADYDKVVEMDPKYTLAFFNRGLSKAGMDRHEEALVDFDLALRLDPNNHLIYNGKGVSLYALKRYQEAIANYDAALRLKPDFGQAYFNRGFARYLGLNDKNGGCSDWMTAANLKYKSAESALKNYCEGSSAQPTPVVPATNPAGQPQKQAKTKPQGEKKKK